MDRTQTAAACLTDQIQDAVHPLDGVHQIAWVARRRVVGSSSCTSAGRVFYFGEDAVLMDKNESSPCDPYFAEIPRWHRGTWYHLARRPSWLVQADDPVGVR